MAGETCTLTGYRLRPYYRCGGPLVRLGSVIGNAPQKARAEAEIKRRVHAIVAASSALCP